MKRIAISICIATTALGLGACEKQSADNLPEHYMHKWDTQHAEAGHEKAPAHGEKEKAPGEAHKS